MRKICLLATLCSPFAHADVVMVEANSMMRLPANASVLQLERLEVADYGTLLIPAGVTRVNIDQLHLGREARITLVPAEGGIELRVAQAELDEGSQINARGAPGTFEKPARPARDLNVRIESLQAPQWMQRSCSTVICWFSGMIVTLCDFRKASPCSSLSGSASTSISSRPSCSPLIVARRMLTMKS